MRIGKSFLAAAIVFSLPALATAQDSSKPPDDTQKPPAAVGEAAAGKGLDQTGRRLDPRPGTNERRRLHPPPHKGGPDEAASAFAERCARAHGERRELGRAVHLAELCMGKRGVRSAQDLGGDGVRLGTAIEIMKRDDFCPQR